MSIYIKGMEMPKSCHACMFFAQTDYWNKEDETDILSRCKRTGEKTWESVNGYLPHCPLIPVPPHGRLGDLDALEAKCTDEKGSYFSYEAAIIGEAVSSAPTIIPADKEGE